MNRGLFTSASQEYRTPDKLYALLDEEFNFDFDPCPQGADFDGLEVEWGQCNFVNPPYITQIQDAFVAKAVEEFRKGKTVVMLLPARTSTARFHKHILPNASEIRFIEGRIKFIENPKGGAPFPSMIVVFEPLEQRIRRKLKGVFK